MPWKCGARVPYCGGVKRLDGAGAGLGITSREFSRIPRLRHLVSTIGSTAIAPISFVLAACNGYEMPDLPEDTTVFIKVGEVTYEVPIRHRPRATEWPKYGELERKIVAGEGRAQNALEVDKFRFLLDPERRDGSQTFFQITGPRSPSFNDSLGDAAATIESMSQIQISASDPQPAVPNTQIHRVPMVLTISFNDGSAFREPFPCSAQTITIESGSPSYFNCFLWMKIAGGNAMMVKSNPGREIEALEQDITAGLSLISLMTIGVPGT